MDYQENNYFPKKILVQSIRGCLKLMTDQSQSKKAGVMIPIPQVLSPQIYPAQFLVRCVNHLASVPVPTIQCQLGGIQHGTSKNLQIKTINKCLKHCQIMSLSRWVTTLLRREAGRWTSLSLRGLIKLQRWGDTTTLARALQYYNLRPI